MKSSRHRRTFRKPSPRRGIAAVEAAIILPLIGLILLGAIDVGQSVYVAQVVNEASREGARQASRFDTKTESEVRTTVRDFVRNAFPGVPDAEVTVNFANSSGGTIANGDLTTLGPGSEVSVQVILAYDSVRWIPGFIGLGGRSIETTTIMRRE